MLPVGNHKQALLRIAHPTDIWSAFVGGLTATMWVSAAICVLGAAMVLRFLPDGRALVAPDSGQLSAESAYADEPGTR
jgi:hypothetical protein